MKQVSSKYFFSQSQKYAPVLLRISLALVFLWFGINQILFPQDFIGYLPDFVFQPQQGMMGMMNAMVSYLPQQAYSLLLINGSIEIILGILLLLIGLFTRFASLILAFHLLIIAFSLGYNDVAIRDFGLALATSQSSYTTKMIGV